MVRMRIRADEIERRRYDKVFDTHDLKHRHEFLLTFAQRVESFHEPRKQRLLNSAPNMRKCGHRYPVFDSVCLLLRNSKLTESSRRSRSALRKIRKSLARSILQEARLCGILFAMMRDEKEFEWTKATAGGGVAASEKWQALMETEAVA